MPPLDFLNLPQGKRCIFWGKALEARKLRKSEDRDLLVEKDTFEKIKNTFPQTIFWYNKNHDPFLLFPELNIEIFKNLPWFEGKEEEILKNAETIDGLPYISISDLIQFKKYLNRPKDLEDLQLLEEYQKTLI